MKNCLVVRAFRFIAFFVFLSFHFTTKAQTSIDHWETVIYAAGQWRYLSPESPVAANWRMTGFDDGNWAMGNGGIGYGDDDDATEIAPTNALFLRKEFEIIDVSKLELAILHADFDDGFVAYINGVEIARANVDGLPPAFNAEASDLREAEMYQGGLPVPFTLTKDFVQDHFISGTNTLAIQVHNFNGLNSSDLSAIFFLSLGINDASMDYRPTPSWFIDPSFSSNLPILKINTMGGVIQDDPRIRAHLGVINNGPGQLNNSGDPFNGYDGAISIEIRGASSQLFPKKAYSMETQQADGSNNNVELLGLPKENDWVLNGPYSDKTLLRNVLTYGLVRDMGPYYSPRTRYCELMINEDYRGVYILIEKIKQDKNRVDIDPLEPEDITGDELTGGYIVQIDRETPEGFGWYSNHAPYPFFVYEDPDGDQLAQVQKNYIRNHLNAFENAMINPNYADRYKDFIDPASFIDYFLINELTKDVDAFKLSFFMHKDKDSKGGKLIFGPVWDFNLGYGNFDFCEENPQGWAYNFDIDCGSTLPFWIKRLLQIPELRNQLKCRWESLREGVLSLDNIYHIIDSTNQEIEAARIRNFERWPTIGEYVWPNAFVGTTYQAELNYLKNWISSRLAWMDNQMPGDCSPTSTETLPADLSLSIQPNPFSNYLELKLSAPLTDDLELIIYDALGRALLRYTADQFQNDVLQLDTQAWPGHWFSYALMGKGGIWQRGRLIKQ